MTFCRWVCDARHHSVTSQETKILRNKARLSIGNSLEVSKCKGIRITCVFTIKSEAAITKFRTCVP